MPQETRNIMCDLGLPSDFLSSDSSLTDVPSDPSASSASSANQFCLPTIRLSPPAVDGVYSVAQPPTTPIKQIPPHEPKKQARIKRPKVSPYFPEPLVDPESCLPFPPINAPSFGLVQEQLAHDPFRLLIATIFLNRTRGGVALPVLFQVFEEYPTIESLATADLSNLVSMIRRLGFQNQRAKKCISLARIWLTQPPAKGRRYRKLHYPRKSDGRDINPEKCIVDDDPRVAWEAAHLPGVGAYSLDSWRIFCRDELRGLAHDWKGTGTMDPSFVPEWKSVLPQDKELRAYLTWMWLKEGWIWDRNSGKLSRAGDKTMRAARRGGVAYEEDGNWILETSPVKKAANGLTTWS
ncbi:hypothetical protein FE257_002419 [Aspergillus nanangensis]|uniref:HhH-GPD domain-containing protein n=1 Tax=Aspergillus nanangensis TaxID=2582783 RepID=A0AAD4GQ32_ASPNN|nr:hypothetical protein FE257_002419 [Aspergillus nanangensis]